MSRYSRMLNGGYDPRERHIRQCGCPEYCSWVYLIQQAYQAHAAYRVKTKRRNRRRR